MCLRSRESSWPTFTVQDFPAQAHQQYGPKKQREASSIISSGTSTMPPFVGSGSRITRAPGERVHQVTE